MALGLYIHVPFCDGKCPYCDFYSLSMYPFSMDSYTLRVCRELASWGERLAHPHTDTLYFGGGTPSLLGEHRLSAILQQAAKSFSLRSPEITVEVNPTRGKGLDFSALRSFGVNRLSIGLQSACEGELRRLGRKHSAQDAAQTIEQARRAGITNLSLDLMLAVPGQTPQSLTQSIQFCAQCGAEHISAYLLKIEEGTPFYRQQESLHLMDEDSQADQYLLACSLLEKAGYQQYEISNFSHPGRESRHNLKYWNGEEYLGIGPSAHSFLQGKRFYSPRNLKIFLEAPVYQEEGPGGSEEEYAMLRLRLAEGLREDAYQRRFCCPIPAGYRDRAVRYQSHGLTVCDHSGIRFTPQGFLVSNPLTAEILWGNTSGKESGSYENSD